MPTEQLNLDLAPFREYTNLFVQRTPHYTIKNNRGGSWRTRKKPLSDIAVQAHLDGKYSVGTLGRWYPGFAVLDFDGFELEAVQSVREAMGLNEQNSMLSSSESADSYHLLIRPLYKSEPPTLKLLNNILGPYCRDRRVEVFPQPRHTIRLPFGPGQKMLDPAYFSLNTWPDKLYWFQKLDEFELFDLTKEQLEMDLGLDAPPVSLTSTYREGQALWQEGLQMHSSRNEAQFKVIYYMWRKNTPPEVTKKTVWNWIQKKHNGFSKEILANPQHVKKEIERQVDIVYERYERCHILPDATHNEHNGYLSKPDMINIAQCTQGFLPKMKFLFHVVKYSYPRRYRSFVNVHTDKLTSWASSHTYQKYLEDFEGAGLVKRGASYWDGKFSKSLRLNWNYQDSSMAILDDGRSADTFKDTARLAFEPREFRQLMEGVGVKRTTAIEMAKNIFD